jgi:hypothetical protein
VPHPLVLAMFPTPGTAVEAAAALHGLGVSREAISVVARTHERQGVYARAMDATPGAEFEDSRSAGRLGELGAAVIAAVASVMPGVGPLVAAGPLSAELGEAAGHLAGNLTGVLERAGVDASRAAAWQHAVEGGAVLLGIHVGEDRVGRVRDALNAAGATTVQVARWDGEAPA